MSRDTAGWRAARTLRDEQLMMAVRLRDKIEYAAYASLCVNIIEAVECNRRLTDVRRAQNNLLDDLALFAFLARYAPSVTGVGT